MQVNMHEAKTHIIAKNGVPAVRLMRVTDRPRKRILGQGKGLVKMSDDFLRPITNKEIDEMFGL